MEAENLMIKDKVALSFAAFASLSLFSRAHCGQIIRDVKCDSLNGNVSLTYERFETVLWFHCPVRRPTIDFALFSVVANR